MNKHSAAATPDDIYGPSTMIRETDLGSLTRAPFHPTEHRHDLVVRCLPIKVLYWPE